jgi:hypothetical protein
VSSSHWNAVAALEKPTKKSPAFREALFSSLPIPEPGPVGAMIDSLALLTRRKRLMFRAMQAAHAAELVPHCVSLASEDAPDIAASFEPVVLHSLKWEAISA